MLPPPMLPLLDLLVFPPEFMFPPELEVVLVVLIGVDVLIGVEVVLVVMLVVEFVVVVLPALFVFSLAHPMPRAAIASKVRRAKVLRIELSPVTQRVRLLGSLRLKCLLRVRWNASALAQSVV
jgi:hypothetical protein